MYIVDAHSILRKYKQFVALQIPSPVSNLASQILTLPLPYDHQISRIYLQQHPDIKTTAAGKAGICLYWSLKRWQIFAHQYAFEQKGFGQNLANAGKNPVDQSFFDQ